MKGRKGQKEMVENCHQVGLPIPSKVVSSQRVFMYHSEATSTCPDPLSHSQSNEQELRRPKDGRGESDSQNS